MKIFTFESEDFETPVCECDDLDLEVERDMIIQTKAPGTQLKVQGEEKPLINHRRVVASLNDVQVKGTVLVVITKTLES